LTPLTSFSLRGEPATQEGPVGALLHEGRETGLRIHAARLEAQFHVQPNLFLLFFTDDSPYEEELQILLLDTHFQLLDGLELGQPYTPGMLSGLDAQGEQRLLFDFFADTRLLLSVHPEGVFHMIRRLPSFARPLKGRFFSRHYLTLQETPGATDKENRNAQ
jgi:hypothetical protein